MSAPVTSAPSWRSLALVASPPWWRALAAFLLALVAVAAVILLFVPWQQTVGASGTVVLLSSGDPPRIVEPEVGGNDSKLSGDLLRGEGERIRREKRELEARRAEARSRDGMLQGLFTAAATSSSVGGPDGGKAADRVAALAQALAAAEEREVGMADRLDRLEAGLVEFRSREEERSRRSLARPGAELVISDSDVSLIERGQKVRLRFAGWTGLNGSDSLSRTPAVFPGVVAGIESVRGEKGRFRLLIRPDEERVRSGLDPPWPPPERLRPGTRVSGSVLLGRVPLWKEIGYRLTVFSKMEKRG